MSKERSSYRQIMKATSIFGGVQVFDIILKLIRSKIVATLLGPAGMGIIGLLDSTLGLISTATNFGLGTSAIRDISEATNTNNKDKIDRTVSIMKKLVWLTGLLGMVITIILSPLLSKITFGNYDYTIAYIILSLVVLVRQLTSGQNILLRGLRKLPWLAKANILGSIVGLIITVPLYYNFGVDGIVPSLVITALAILGIQYFYGNKVKIDKITLSFKQALAEGKGMLRLGIMLSLSGFISMSVSYFVRVFISQTGDVDDVGLYNAGFSIIGTYVGLIFTAMGTDYYPRLSQVSNDNVESKTIINQQAEIAILILAPILLLFLVYINWIVILLYTEEFTPINDMILYAAIGMLFKAVSWSISYVILAKGNTKLFFWNELAFNAYMLLLNMIGYKYYGLSGLGVSFLITYILYLVQVYILASRKYEFSFNTPFMKIFGIQLLLAIVCYLVVKQFNEIYVYLVGTILIIISSIYSYIELDKRLNIKSFLKRKQ
ncbi:oligosaccharide flippase family protein [Flavobacteriaceae bacterium Ap0902]|nr:oligosaccharide flippase family protein [Flavobacteriaceae bacterium Ap0902]